MNEAVTKEIIRSAAKHIGNLHQRTKAHLGNRPFNMGYVGRLKPYLLSQIVLRKALFFPALSDALAKRNIIQIQPITSDNVIVAPFKM